MSSHFRSYEEIVCDLIDTLKKNFAMVQSPDAATRQQAATKIDDEIIQMHSVLYDDKDRDPNYHLEGLVASAVVTNDLFIQFIKYIFIKEFAIEYSTLHLIITGYIRQYAVAMDTIPIFIKYFPVYKCEIFSETKTKTAGIMNYIIRRCSKYKLHEHIDQTMIQMLSKSYTEAGELCLTQAIGGMLQEMAKRSELAPMLLKKHIVDPLFDLAHNDAFKTLQLLLTRNKQLVSTYVQTNYVSFFATFNQLIQSDNYVTQRQFLNLLSEILLEKSNFGSMIRYIGERKHLKIIMTLLKNDCNAMAHESFHIFKVFVANPKKARDIHMILWMNQDKLIAFLNKFLLQRTIDDEAFAKEKRIVIEHLLNLSTPQIIKKRNKIT